MKTPSMNPFYKLLFALFLTTAMPASAAPIDMPQSSIKVSFKQMGVVVTGQFKQFSGNIEYSQANAKEPGKTKADVTVQTASFDLGDPSYNTETRKKIWFDSQRFPQASFQLFATEAIPGKLGEFRAQGKLSIKGIERSVVVPVKIISQQHQQIFEGKTTIKRLSYKIGEEEWQDTSIVADDVVIDFRFVTPVITPSLTPARRP